MYLSSTYSMLYYSYKVKMVVNLLAFKVWARYDIYLLCYQLLTLQRLFEKSQTTPGGVFKA